MHPLRPETGQRELVSATGQRPGQCRVSAGSSAGTSTLNGFNRSTPKGEREATGQCDRSEWHVSAMSA
jgi:hypothetical protein